MNNVDGMTLRVAVLAFADVELLDVVGPLQAFATASGLIGGASPAYRVDIVAEKRGPLQASSGLSIVASAGLVSPADIDTLLVAGGRGIEAACRRRPLVEWLRHAASIVRRIGSVCTGAMLLAEAGLLDGRRAVTHWNWCDRLASRHPAVSVERDAIFLQDRGIWTSAGVTAGIDLALAMVEADHGPGSALRAAQELVMFRRRPGGQAQFSAELIAEATASPPLRLLQNWVLENLTADLSIEALASRLAMSPRNFTRLFVRDTGITPAVFVERARLQQARRLLETTTHSIDVIAASCGFRSADVMRRALLRRLGIGPTDYRDRFQAPRSSSSVS